MNRPFRGSLVVATLLVVGGFITVAVAWRTVADQIEPIVQLPYAVSGAVGGLASLGFGLAIATIQRRRHLEAAERAEFARVIAAASGLLAAAQARKGSSS
jgi:hypothetical protein